MELIRAICATCMYRRLYEFDRNPAEYVRAAAVLLCIDKKLICVEQFCEAQWTYSDLCVEPGTDDRFQ